MTVQKKRYAERPMRLRKAEWQSLGGLSNPSLYRKQLGSSWSYWAMQRLPVTTEETNP
jgi:hypothetical protein